MSIYTERNDDNDVINDEDIYRGEPPSHADIPGHGAPSISSISSSTSDSSSSSSSFMAGRRLGAIAAKLELAISRWGRNVRGNSSLSSGSSSSSSSSSSSCSSIVTLTKSQIARRRRKKFRSVSSLRTMQSERDIVARITRMKALEKSREIPREFALYLPPSLTPAPEAEGPASELQEIKNRRITWTTSLPLVLHQLDLATRRPGRNHHKNRQRAAKRAQSAGPSDPELYFERHAFVEGSSEDDYRAPIRRGRKGKNRAVPRPAKPTTILEEPQTKPEAWFLDVANPTWADLRAVGKVLHIHPLTLEDILQQDPREKLEIFSKLGYYFISFRAIESQATREKIRREGGFMKDTNEDNSIGEANVYLTVFKGGICCFHFTDVSEHTDRVRNRMVLLEQVVNMSSDWIAHDILDSIVDSFFPFLHEIEKEVTAIDHMVYSIGDVDPFSSLSSQIRDSPSLKSEDIPGSQDTAVDQTLPPKEKDSHKYYTPAEKLREAYRPRFVSPRLSLRLLVRRVKRQIGGVWSSLWDEAESPPSARQLALRRMARTRKLVTVLGRLLATKSDVVTQIRKRLTKTGSEVIGSEELEVAIYMGDVQDHILTLQTALAHYERMLSQSHPTYLAQLRSESESAKGGTDMNLLLLSTVSIGALCVQPLTSLFSLNIRLPTNIIMVDEVVVGGKLNVFGIIVSLALLIVVAYLWCVQSWWRQAKRRITRY